MKPNELRMIHASSDRNNGRRAYSDAFNHILVSVHRRDESGLDLACAIQLRNDLDRAISNASLDDEHYVNLFT